MKVSALKSASPWRRRGAPFEGSSADLILEELFVCAPAQSTRKIRRDKTNFRYVLSSQKKEHKCVRLFKDRRYRRLQLL